MDADPYLKTYVVTVMGTSVTSQLSSFQQFDLIVENPCACIMSAPTGLQHFTYELGQNVGNELTVD